MGRPPEWTSLVDERALEGTKGRAGLQSEERADRSWDDMEETGDCRRLGAVFPSGQC